MNRSCFFSMETKNKKDDEKGLWTKESKKCHIYLLFLSILIIHTVAISLFTRGFLLTRTELSSSFSSCDDNINESPPSPCYTTPPNSTKDQCWTNPSVDRIVIIVLDALRSNTLSLGHSPAPPKKAIIFFYLLHSSQDRFRRTKYVLR